MSQPEIGTIVEGVGDELFHLFGLVVVVAVPLLVAYRNRLRLIEAGAIHPENEAQVQHTRDQLGYGRPNPSNPQQNGNPTASTNGQAAGGLNEQQDEGGQNREGRRGMSARQYNPDTACPICLEVKECAAETNCGHVFCGNCLIAYWRHGSWLGAVSCPVCRQMVTIILPVFQEEEQNSGEGRRILAEIRDYNRRFSGEPRPVVYGLHLRPSNPSTSRSARCFLPPWCRLDVSSKNPLLLRHGPPLSHLSARHYSGGCLRSLGVLRRPLCSPHPGNLRHDLV